MISSGIHIARSIADKEISSLRREGLKVKLIAKNFISVAQWRASRGLDFQNDHFVGSNLIG